MKKLIMASASPRREKIFEELNLDFDIIKSTFEEKISDYNFSYAKIENLAYNKALDVALKINYPAVIISADTVVVLDNTILCKPKDKSNAFNMLKSLSNRQHFVVTSICGIDTTNNRKKIVSTTSYVQFEELSDEMINDYIETFNPLDKAGAYGIQELPNGFIKSVNGSFENIIGLCPKALKKVLNVLKFDIEQSLNKD